MANDMRIDLNSVRKMWQLTVCGDTADGELDLEFESLVTASAFISATNIQDKARLTFPDTVEGFNHKVSITVPDYTAEFMPIG